MTPHISSNLDQIAPLVIMPGDPLRAKYIAQNYLENYEIVNELRGMTAYTGTYKGKRITVMASGMGNPSMGIYSHELYNVYNVQKIIRIGTCGSYVKKLNLGDIVLADKIYSRSTYSLLYNRSMDSTIDPSNDLRIKIEALAKKENIDIHVGTIYNTDVFYSQESYEQIRDYHGCICVEMESFALAVNAASAGKECAILLTVSDSFVKSGELTPKERETGLDRMIKLALESL